MDLFGRMLQNVLWISLILYSLKFVTLLVRKNVIPEYNINSLEQRRNVSGMCQIYRMVTGVVPPTVIDILPPFNQPNKISYYVNQSHHLQVEIK